MNSGGSSKKWKLLYAGVALMVFILLLLAIFFGILGYRKIKAAPLRTPDRYEFSNQKQFSNFDSNNFKCTGRCECEETRRTAAAAVAMGRGMVALVAGVSAYLAIQSAQKLFQKDCLTSYRGSCKDENIISFVDECYEIADEEEFDFNNNIMESTTRTKNKNKVKKQNIKKNQKKKKNLEKKPGEYVGWKPPPKGPRYGR